jgi:hypothetical protein
MYPPGVSSRVITVPEDNEIILCSVSVAASSSLAQPPLDQQNGTRYNKRNAQENRQKNIIARIG